MLVVGYLRFCQNASALHLVRSPRAPPASPPFPLQKQHLVGDDLLR